MNVEEVWNSTEVFQLIACQRKLLHVLEGLSGACGGISSTVKKMNETLEHSQNRLLDSSRVLEQISEAVETSADKRRINTNGN